MKPRTSTGSAITELGPALFLLLVVIFFPLLDLAMVGLTYFCCATCTDLQADKAAVVAKSQAMDTGGVVQAGVPGAWQHTGMGAFAKLAQPPTTQVSYPIIGTTPYVQVATTYVASPFLPIPFIPGVPGISAPINFTFVSKRVIEDPSNLGK